MVIPTQQQAYAVSSGTSAIPQYIFRDRDPVDTEINYPLYTRWVNTITKGIWYLEAFAPSGGLVVAQWRCLGPVVINTIDPTADDYQYPEGQVWINRDAMKFWGLVNVTGTVATWEELSSGAATGLLTLTGDTGGAVSGDGARNINILGGSGVAVAGNPGTNTLTINLAGGKTAVDEVIVDAATAPGTNPVIPDATGDITVTGGQIAAGSTANVIRTNSLAANTYTIEVQRAKSEPGSLADSNGVCHFNDNDFIVDNNAYVSLQSFTPYTVICAGTGSGAALQDVSGVGTAGQVLTSTGAGALPTWQDGHTVSGVLQQVRATFSTPGSTLATIPHDNTIPQQTEGFELMTVNITPKSSTSVLCVEFNGAIIDPFGKGTVALFRDAAADAINAIATPQLPGQLYVGGPSPFNFKTYITSGSTSTTTFKIRVGINSSGAFGLFYNQGYSGGAYAVYGGLLTCVLSVTEYAS